MLMYMENVTIGDLRYWLRRYAEEGSVDPDVLALRDAILNGNVGASDVCAIYDFVKENIPYGSDPDWTELFIHPRILAQYIELGDYRAVDCDDHSMLVTALSKSLGDQARVMLLDTSYDNEIDHAIAEIWLDSATVGTRPLEWVSLDTSSKNLPLGWYIRSSARVVA